MIIGVPSGIGDISWIYSKLMHIDEKLEVEVADGWPWRSVPYLELLPRVTRATYGDFNYHHIIAFQSVNDIHNGMSWAERKQVAPSKMLIEANKHLEAGLRLEKWLPDLPCNFHYEMLTTKDDEERAAKIVMGMKHPLIGISAASYRGSEAWKTWNYGAWSEFLKWLNAETGGEVLLLGGFWDDLTSKLAEDGHKDVVGRTSIGTAVEVLKLLDGYIGFSSGLGMLNTVLHRPTFMLWPDHQRLLSTSWASPEMLESGLYTASLWRDPEDVKPTVRHWLRYC